MNDGGPAFPAVIPLDHSAGQGKDFPNYTDTGMSLRDYFAAKAMQALVSNPRWDERADSEHGVAEIAYIIANAMIQQRNK